MPHNIFIEPFDVPGADRTFAAGINNAGQIVGSGLHKRGFLKDGTNITTLAVPDSETTGAKGINDAGQIVGLFSKGDGTGEHGFLKNGTTFVTIDVPGALGTVAQGINNAGQVVGYFIDPGAKDPYKGRHGFLWDQHSFTTIDYPGAIETDAEGINDAGQIVGHYQREPGIYHGFVWDRGKFTGIDVPGVTGTMAYGINSAAQIAGAFVDIHVSPNSRGFLTDGITFTTIQVPGNWETGAADINDVGQIVGTFLATTPGETEAHGYVASIANSRILFASPIRRLGRIPVDLLALVLGPGVQARSTLPDPLPIEVLKAHIRERVRTTDPEQKRQALELARALGVYVAVLEEELHQGPEDSPA